MTFEEMSYEIHRELLDLDDAITEEDIKRLQKGIMDYCEEQKMINNL